jgi:preprotein translocase subunit SecE
VSDTSAASGSQRDPRKGETQRTGPITFLRQSVAELRKVVYPTQKQLITYFVVVLVFVLVMMAIVSVLDVAFGRLVFEVFTGIGQ